MPSLDRGVVEDRPIAPGGRIAGTALQRGGRLFTAQRIDGRTWLVEVAGYQSTVLIGDEGVLVVDPLSVGRGERLLAALQLLTQKPLTTLVYTHHHADHIGDAPLFEVEGGRIVASEACAGEVARRPLRVPPPTEVVADGGVISHDGIAVELHSLPGHCTDNTAIFLPDTGVVQVVDMIHPTQIEFERFGLAEDLVLYERSLRRLSRWQGWRTLVPGHVQVGWREDVEQVLRYLTQLRPLAEESHERFPPQDFVDPEAPPSRWTVERQRAAVAWIVEELRPRWGGWSGFEDFAPSHAHAMFWDSGYLTSVPSTQPKEETK
jgi:glyoxylase-like metal-dependent hydrolase (beta-lactamase superfamily II)